MVENSIRRRSAIARVRKHSRRPLPLSNRRSGCARISTNLERHTAFLVLTAPARASRVRGRNQCEESASVRSSLIFSICLFSPLRSNGTDSDSEAPFVMCLQPVSAWIGGVTKNGKPRLVFSAKYGYTEQPIYHLPCGKCLGCQVDKRNRWIARMELEHYCHDNTGAFITLTYRDSPPSLVKKDVQNFLKRFRNITRDFGITIPYFKYFFCGEYGHLYSRPHYHGLLFGIDPFSPAFDCRIVSFKDGYPIFSSPVLEKIWSNGFITVDRITTSNIRYVSKYILKQHQKKGDEFTLKSIGLGSDFFFYFPTEKRSLPVRGAYFQEYEKGLIHLEGKNGKYHALPIPYKAFDRYIEYIDPDLLASFKASRRDFVVRHNTTPAAIASRREWLQVMEAPKPNERILHDE